VSGLLGGIALWRDWINFVVWEKCQDSARHGEKPYPVG
jgi:hypothetical protein